MKPTLTHLLKARILAARLSGLSSYCPQPAAAKSGVDCARETKRLRAQLTERQIDKTLADSFPASDPPSWY